MVTHCELVELRTLGLRGSFPLAIWEHCDASTALFVRFVAPTQNHCNLQRYFCSRAQLLLQRWQNKAMFFLMFIRKSPPYGFVWKDIIPIPKMQWSFLIPIKMIISWLPGDPSDWRPPKASSMAPGRPKKGLPANAWAQRIWGQLDTAGYSWYNSGQSNTRVSVIFLYIYIYIYIYMYLYIYIYI